MSLKAALRSFLLVVAGIALSESVRMIIRKMDNTPEIWDNVDLGSPKKLNPAWKTEKRDKKNKGKKLSQEQSDTQPDNRDTFNFKPESEFNNHKHCRQRIHAERAGRIAAERLIRENVVKIISDSNVGFPSLVIGHVESAFVSKRGTPRQGLLVGSSRGFLQFSSDLPVESFSGLEDYSHLIVLFIFHDNTNLPKLLLRSAASSSEIPNSDPLSTRSSTLATSKFNAKVPLFAAKVFPPLLKGENTGVFATRSPHHPNPFGQSLVRIEAIDAKNRRILISGLDMIEGTPILDIKPWNPADCPVCLHAIVCHGKKVCEPWDNSSDSLCQQASNEFDKIAKASFSSGTANPCAGSFATRVPGWVEAGISDPYELPVEYESSAVGTLTELVNAGKLKFYAPGETESVKAALRAILSLDIRSFHQGRGKRGKSPKSARDVAEDTAKRNEHGQNYEVNYDTLNVLFTVKQQGEDDDPFVLVKTVQLSEPL
ncbi:hypothetical protein HK100_000294 [Physocladia obscura]|uniref:TsaA-like domain-containing protein n=1 Tax=Physocladia obscura TaxID=109957 RepID=A0AAD5XBW9_9FUNG|nr:hypothetical protein HK100_000294 [Physocladia obscura]